MRRDCPRRFKKELEVLIDRDTVILMETVTISPKYQVVIPQRIREQLGLRSGEKVQMVPYNGRVEIIPSKPIKQMRGFVRGINTEVDTQ